MIWRASLVVLALAAALVPLPAETVERLYSSGFYLRLQSQVTPVTNHLPVSLLDVAAAILMAVGLWVFVARVRRAGLRSAILHGLRSLVVTAAVAYLAFVAMWGLNYRRVPLEQKLEYDSTRITRDAAIRFGTEAARRVNAGYAAAHATQPDDGALARAFDEAQRLLGATRTAVVGVPKQSLLNIYFRRAAINGMTVPFFLDVIVNPDLLPVERPFTLAHEWAHLAGYADESEANFVAWLATSRGDALAQYSAWLEAYQYAARSLPRGQRRLLPPLDDGPRADLAAMRERYERSSPIVRNAARDVYDSYLRANRVAEGIESYDAVVRLMLGSRFDEAGAPRMRSR
jgi:hypothetical protein